MTTKLKKNRKDKIVYSLNVGDLQNVAKDTMNRDLTENEIEIVTRKIGDFINWYESIEILFTGL